jgi:hypothetical protein
MEAYRKAQMEDIMQRTQSARETAPLDLQLKQQSVKLGDLNFESGQTKLAKDKLDLETGQMEAGIKRIDNYTNLMQVAAAQLSNVPPPARHAWLAQFAKDNKIDVNNPAVQSIWQQTSQIRPELLPQAIEGFVKKLALTKASHLQKIAEINAQGANQVTLEGMRESARAKLQKEKLNTVATYEAELAKAKSPSQKASVALAWALKTADPEEQIIFKQHAKAFEDQSKQLNSQTIAAEAQKEAMDRLRNKTPITNQPRDLTKGTTKSGIGFTITPTSTD